MTFLYQAQQREAQLIEENAAYEKEITNCQVKIQEKVHEAEQLQQRLKVGLMVEVFVFEFVLLFIFFMTRSFLSTSVLTLCLDKNIEGKGREWKGKNYRGSLPFFV